MANDSKNSAEPTTVNKRRALIQLIIGVILLVICAASFVVDPILMMSKHYTRVDYATLVHRVLSSEFENVHVSAYLFNITNADRFLSGTDRNLKVKEVGPFTYQENRTNDELVIDNERGVLSYIPRQKITFLPEESVGRPEELRVFMPNVVMLSLASKLSAYSNMAKFGFELLTAGLHSKSIVNTTAEEILWGYNEPLTKLGNNLLPGWINFPKLGLLDRLYDKKATYRFEVSTRNHDKFMVKTVNGLEGLKSWGFPEERSRCNTYTDVYEGLAYPPDLRPSQPLRIYRPILCRFFELDYQGTKPTEYGTEALAYKLSNRSYLNLPENKCLCSNGICEDGVSDMSPCFYDLPVVLSNAHFMGADPSVYHRVEGMAPNEEEHGSEFTVDPFMGMVLTTKFSVQVNVMLGDVNHNSEARKFSNMLVPVAYFKIVQPKLVEETVATIKFIRVYAPYTLLGIQIFLIGLGIICLSSTVRIIFWNCVHPRRKGVALELATVAEHTAKDVNAREPLVHEKD